MAREQIIVHRPVDDYGLVPAEDLAPEDALAPGEVTYDEHGNPVPGVPLEFTSDGWAVAPAAEEESQETFGSVPVTGMRLFNRSRVSLRVDDEVTVRGERWKVVGVPAEWDSPYSTFQGTVVSVARVS